MQNNRNIGLAARFLCLLVRGYRLFISPLLGQNCRFYPTCSQYALEALMTHGALKGGWLTVRRLLRCVPWSRSAPYDPVPPCCPQAPKATAPEAIAPERAKPARNRSKHP